MINAAVCCFHRNRNTNGRFQMSLSHKFFSLALAVAFILPAALTVMNQAAQIVA
jgi:hypothetical protein